MARPNPRWPSEPQGDAKAGFNVISPSGVDLRPLLGLCSRPRSESQTHLCSDSNHYSTDPTWRFHDPTSACQTPPGRSNAPILNVSTAHPPQCSQVPHQSHIPGYPAPTPLAPRAASSVVEVVHTPRRPLHPNSSARLGETPQGSVPKRPDPQGHMVLLKTLPGAHPVAAALPQPRSSPGHPLGQGPRPDPSHAPFTPSQDALVPPLHDTQTHQPAGLSMHFSVGPGARRG